jgi:hypothetical protein
MRPTEAFAMAREAAKPFEPAKPIPIVPAPPDALPIDHATLLRHAPPGHVYIRYWVYRGPAGELLGYVGRYDDDSDPPSGKKQFRPFTYCRHRDGSVQWRARGFPEPWPLYGLDRLAARPDAPVLIVEGEKSADAAQARFPNYIAITSPFGCGRADKADWSALSGREVIIWPDADEGGEAYADDVVGMATEAGARSVRVVDVAELPLKWDLAEPLPPGISDADLAKLLEGAQPPHIGLAAPELDGAPTEEPYPVEALGEVLAPAAAAIARKVQAPLAIAGQSVLGAAALAAQGHADVQMPYGQHRPTSLFQATIADSGDRKTTADSEALRPIREHERRLREAFQRDFARHAVAESVWQLEKRRIEADKQLAIEKVRQRLLDLGPPPTPPLDPMLTSGDPTVEGLIKAWPKAPAALGLFSAEGGQFIGGAGMSHDNRLKTAAVLSQLWDGETIRRVRAGDGVLILPGRRLSLHLLVQREVARQFFNDPLLRNQGILSRILVASPATIAGTRTYREVAHEDEAAIDAYSKKIEALLAAPLPLAPGRQNELEPHVLRFTAAAKDCWTQFYDHIEEQSGPGGGLHGVRDFAAKAAEHAARIAGVLTIVTNYKAAEIDIHDMERAIALADWYVNEAVRLRCRTPAGFESSAGARAEAAPDQTRAEDVLLKWMQGQPKSEWTIHDLQNGGPRQLRKKERLDAALDALESDGLITRDGGRIRLRPEGDEA